MKPSFALPLLFALTAAGCASTQQDSSPPETVVIESISASGRKDAAGAEELKLFYTDAGRTKSVVQRGKACEYKTGPAVVIREGLGSRIQPNNPYGCERNKAIAAEEPEEK